MICSIPCDRSFAHAIRSPSPIGDVFTCRVRLGEVKLMARGQGGELGETLGILLQISMIIVVWRAVGAKWP